MPRKPNYQFEKRQKELDRKARKEEKALRRQERANAGEEPAPPEGEATEEPTS